MDNADTEESSMKTIDDLIRAHYGGGSSRIRSFDTAVGNAISAGYNRVLDAGCGSTAPLLRKYSDRCDILGVDLVRAFPPGTRAVTADLIQLPFPERSFSLVCSQSVFEHLTEPKLVLQEFYRVLSPGGLCIISTPNKYDYTSIVANYSPQRFHQWFVNRVFVDGGYDTFPTMYRANTPRFYRKVEQSGKWCIRELRGVRHYPANLVFSSLLFRLGIAYDWAIACLRLTALQPTLLVILERL